MRGILVISHCILNPYTAVGGSTPNRDPMRALLGWTLSRDVALVQMPCPEFTHAGAGRGPRTRDGYDTPEFRADCERLAAGLAGTLCEHRAAGHRILGIVGIEGSPSCGVELTTRGHPGVERKEAGEGIYTETLRRLLSERGIEVPYIGLPHRRQEVPESQWLARLDALLSSEESG